MEHQLKWVRTSEGCAPPAPPDLSRGRAASWPGSSLCAAASTPVPRIPHVLLRTQQRGRVVQVLRRGVRLQCSLRRLRLYCLETLSGTRFNGQSVRRGKGNASRANLWRGPAAAARGAGKINSPYTVLAARIGSAPGAAPLRPSGAAAGLLRSPLACLRWSSGAAASSRDALLACAPIAAAVPAPPGSRRSAYATHWRSSAMRCWRVAVSDACGFALAKKQLVRNLAEPSR